MRICFVTSECVPYVKTGGLADVAGALPQALAERGCDVRVFLPFYAAVEPERHDLSPVPGLEALHVPVAGRGVPFSVWHERRDEVDHYLIDCPRYFARPFLYTSDPDEAERFVLFQRAVLEVLQRQGWAPDVLHCNDWHTGLLPTYLRTAYAWDRLFAGTASVMTIHNLAYQGRFHAGDVGKAGLTYDGYFPGGPYELYGTFSFLKAGLVHADVVSTVSPTYAREILEPQQGYGLDGVLRTREDDLFGILNGIDVDVWNPAADPHLAQNYTAANVECKELNKRALLEEVGLPYVEGRPVLGIISRFAEQKGLELVEHTLEGLIRHADLQFVVLGSGEPDVERFFRWAADAFPDRVSVTIGYDDPLSHRIEAGADVFVMPSLYEPCGLNQMYSLRYGTVPVVRHTGGLADTVRDADHAGPHGNGFSFVDYSPYALFETILRALHRYQKPDAWRRLQREGMCEDFSWGHSAEQYLDLYRAAVKRRKGKG